MKRTAVLICAVVIAQGVYAQDEVLVYGTITDHYTRSPLLEGRVVVASERGIRDTMPTGPDGTYELYLLYGRMWQLRYEAPGRVTKLIAIDTRRIPPAEQEGGHGMKVDVRLFRAEPGKDYSALKDPMSIARYVDSTRNIEWDLAMAERMNERIAGLVPDSLQAGALSTPASAGGSAVPPPGTDPLKLFLAGVIAVVLVGFAIRAVRGSGGIN